MDNKDLEQLEEEIDDLVDNDIEELPSEEVIEDSNDFYNQNLNNQIRNIRRQNKGNQNTINRLKQRNANTMTKGVEAPKSTPSSSNEEEAEDSKQSSHSNIGQKIGDRAKETVQQAKEKVKQEAKNVAKKTVSKVISIIVKNPYVLVIIGVFLLIMIIPVLWGAYDSDSNGGDGGSSGNIIYVEGYESCESITVSGSGTYDLETYVAGVISHEAYQDEGIEALKAQAVAARTFAINSTNNCTTSIGNSQASQTFSETPTDISIEAANATAGQVLTYDGSVFSAMYDSFCYADGDCPDAVKNSDDSYTVTYTKMPNGETHQITLSQEKQYSRIVKGGGHAHGMSQLVSYQMASEGKKYDEILKFFYSDGVEISTISETSSTDYDATGIPKDINDLKNRYYFNFDKDTYLEYERGNNHLFGQCVWYAYHRAMDIVNSSDLSIQEKEKRINSLMTHSGNGGSYVSNMDASVFKKTTNIDNIKAPSVISWQNNEYGHVAIIEEIKNDSNGNKVFVVSEGWRTRDCSNRSWCTHNSIEQLWSVTNFNTYSSNSINTYNGSYYFVNAASLLE